MNPFLGEFIGTMLLIILGDGVVANVILDKTKGYNGGLMSITFGWGMAVFCIRIRGSIKMLTVTRPNDHSANKGTEKLTPEIGHYKR